MEADCWHRLQGSSWCGVPAAQTWVDFYMWEALLNGYPHLNAIVEIGTWEGGFSKYLHAQALGRGIEFATYDVIRPQRDIPGYRHLDVFAHADTLGETLVEWQPLALLCDGGNKPRELKTFSRYLDSRSVIVVHDWGTEMLPSDVPDNVEETHGGWLDDIGSMSRVFRVKPEEHDEIS